jgi:hypothetical protein
MIDKNGSAASVGQPLDEEMALTRIRKPRTIGPDGKSGAFIADGDAAQGVIRQWLERYGRDAAAFSTGQADDFIRLVEEGRFNWIALVSGGHALTLPWFDRLFRAAIETDTEIWTANDDTEFGLHLFCSMMANWDFLGPYVPESNEATSLTSLRDGLARIEARSQSTAAAVVATEIPPTESSSVSSQPEEGLIVKNGLVINTKQFTVTYQEQQCFLGNSISFLLAASLGRAPGKWHSFGELRDDVWKDEQTEDSTIGRTLRLLRNKLNEARVTGITIENSRNMKKHARLVIS